MLKLFSRHKEKNSQKPIPCEETRKRLDEHYFTNLREAIELAGKKKSTVTSVLIEPLGRESDRDLFYELLVSTFHGNNGIFPSNMVQFVGKKYVAALVYQSLDSTEMAIGLAIDDFISTLNFGTKVPFNVRLYEFKIGDGYKKVFSETQTSQPLPKYSQAAFRQIEVSKDKDGGIETSAKIFKGNRLENLIKDYSAKAC